MYICHRVTGCSLLCSEKEEIIEIIEFAPSPEPEVEEVAAPPPLEPDVEEVTPPPPTDAGGRWGDDIWPGSK